MAPVLRLHSSLHRVYYKDVYIDVSKFPILSPSHPSFESHLILAFPHLKTILASSTIMTTGTQHNDLTHALIPQSYESRRIVKFGDSPVIFRCPLCSSETRTYVIHESGVRTWIVCSGLCLLGCWFGCCILPFCAESLQEPRHFCSLCNKEVSFGKRSIV